MPHKKFMSQGDKAMNMKKRIFILLPISTILIIFSLMVLNLSCDRNGIAFGAKSESPLKNSKELSSARDIQGVLREIAKLYSDRVVYISTEQTVKLPSHPFFNDPFFREFFGQPNIPRTRKHKRKGLGTGFVLSEDGYICTNQHVVAHVDKVKVKINKNIYDAKIIGTDERTDIALLKIEPKEKLKPVYMGDSDSVKVGDWAIAIGNPFGLDKTFTLGVVSATGRKDVDMMGGMQSHIQTDASINPGNSGGPLINIDGEVIGINRMIYSRSGGNIGIGFAIPINKAKVILAELRKHKKVKRGYIGVQIVPLTEEYAKDLGLENNEGALVGQVVDDGPAAKAGIKVGDVIIEAGSKKVKDFTDLVNAVEKTSIGKSIKITVWRNKSKVTLFITVSERP